MITRQYIFFGQWKDAPGQRFQALPGFVNDQCLEIEFLNGSIINADQGSQHHSSFAV